MERVMSLWNNNKAFRDVYEKRILPSLDIRQLIHNGRMRNPDEKPILLSEVQTASEPEVLPAKANTKKMDSVNVLPQAEPVSKSKAPKETNSKPPEAVSKAKSNAAEDTDEFYASEKPNQSPAANGIDEAKLKEMTREEEIAKAKQALERKRKLAEKAAVRVGIRAQKEAEKKLKVLSSSHPVAPRLSVYGMSLTYFEFHVNIVRSVKRKPRRRQMQQLQQLLPKLARVKQTMQLEKTEANVEAPVPALAAVARKIKEPKETVRSRIRSKGQDSLSKVILKKKKISPLLAVGCPSFCSSICDAGSDCISLFLLKQKKKLADSLDDMRIWQANFAF